MPDTVTNQQPESGKTDRYGVEGVVVRRQPDGSFLVNDSKTPDRQPLRFTREEWAAFVAGVKNEEFEP